MRWNRQLCRTAVLSAGVCFASCGDEDVWTADGLKDAGVRSLQNPDEDRELRGAINPPKDMGTALPDDVAKEPAPEESGCVAVSETCNGTDDDCDGRIDEGDQRVGDTCEMDLPGACNFGALECVGGNLLCRQMIEPMQEVCDEADNDCDGLTDENLDGAVCDTGHLGVCAGGTRVCDAGHYRCEADFEPRPEACNSVDDDCNGEIDDMADGLLCGCDEDAPTVNVQAGCGGGGYQPTSHIGECAEETELHIVGQYTAAEDGAVEVNITRVASPMTIVLSSYDPTQWRLRLGAGVRLEQIILNGYEPSQLLDPPANVQVLNFTGVGRYFSACGYAWPGDDQGCNTQGLVDGAQRQTGLPLTSFQGCYSGAGFNIHDRIGD